MLLDGLRQGLRQSEVLLQQLRVDRLHDVDRGPVRDPVPEGQHCASQLPGQDDGELVVLHQVVRGGVGRGRAQ